MTTVTRIDAHMHVWRAATAETPGVQTLVPPQTDVPIDAARAVMAEHRIDRAVLVQPVFRGEDNQYVAGCARKEPDRFAAVCVVDPRVPGAEDRLAQWVEGGCRGLRLRPALPDEESVFGDPATYPLWEMAGRLGVVVNLLCGPRHLETIGRLAERFDGMPIVIDHMGNPNVGLGPDEPAFQRLLALARYPRVFIKVSGFYHFSGDAFPFADCRKLLAAVYDAFGPRRLVWGSDFPHVEVTCGYRRSLEVVARALPNWTNEDRDLVVGDNARRLYWSEAVI